MKKRLIGTLMLLLTLTLAVSGCAPATRPSGTGPTLPPYDATAPDKSEGLLESAQTVLLCLPDSHSGQLIMVPEKLSLSPEKHPAEMTLRKLLGYGGSNVATALSPGLSLQLAIGNAVEISNDVATVNLAPSALQLEPSKLYFVCRAITNTLTQWRDIRFVNVLIDGLQPGLDLVNALPMGSLHHTSEEQGLALWESRMGQRTQETNAQNRRFSSLATLYFPSAAGRGILAETRSLSFSGQTLPQMAQGLLEALGTGTQSLTGVPKVPELTSLMLSTPSLQELPGMGGRAIRLHFSDELNRALSQAGIPRSVMMSSLCYTLTTYLPGIRGILVTIGEENVAAVVPMGLYEGAGQEIVFTDGLMRRADFSSFLLSYGNIFFADSAGQLVKVRRPIPYTLARDVRFLIDQLNQGPQPFDSIQGLSPVLPDGKHLDLTGIARQDDSLFVYFSADAYQQMMALDKKQSTTLIYSVVNSLTQITPFKRVRFVFDGVVPETAADKPWLGGAFFYNPDLVSQTPSTN